MRHVFYFAKHGFFRTEHGRASRLVILGPGLKLELYSTFVNDYLCVEFSPKFWQFLLDLLSQFHTQLFQKRCRATAVANWSKHWVSFKEGLLL